MGFACWHGTNQATAPASPELLCGRDRVNSGFMRRQLLLAGLLSLVIQVGVPAELQIQKRWIYYSTNLWVDKNVAELETIFRRAAQAGYNGVLLTDSKFGRLGEMDARYFRNVERVKRLAADLHLEIVPAVFPIGYSESLLSHDPNLAEALPVRDAVFAVHNGEARPAADTGLALRLIWKDDNWRPDGAGWRVTNPNGHNARVVFRAKVVPFQQYHISVRAMAQAFHGTPEVKVLAGGHQLNFANLGVKATQDWSTHHAVFNSLTNTEVNVYFGCWDGQTGSFAWRDPTIEEAGLLNIVRRDGAPLSVRRENDQPVIEGQDFELVVDPRMGTVPWKGAYEVWHEPPAIRTKGLPEGTQVRVSFYHAITTGDGQVMICPSAPKTVELLRDEARRVHAAWGAKGYFMSHDEIRVLNWDDSCQRRHLDAGAILADNVHTCSQILRQVNPGGDIYVWSDMFDPFHNAHKDYYLVRGDLAGAWAGLDKDVIIGAWYFGKRDESLKWFADRGHRQIIAGYYDAKPEQLRLWLDSARRVPGVLGVIYTTWQHKYVDLERFAEISIEKP